MIVRNNLTLSEIDGELYPNFDEETRYHKPVGIWGHRHAFYLKEFDERRYFELLRNNQLLDYLELVDLIATDMYNTGVTQLRKKQHITSTLKKRTPIKWRDAVDAIHNQVQKSVYQKMVYTGKPVRDTDLVRYQAYLKTLAPREDATLEGFRAFNEAATPPPAKKPAKKTPKKPAKKAKSKS
ncbi:MAG: TnpV protein [Clostridia bacterium]|nr:TnpV protein [Clostridia bacterium]